MTALAPLPAASSAVRMRVPSLEARRLFLADESSETLLLSMERDEES